VRSSLAGREPRNPIKRTTLYQRLRELWLDERACEGEPMRVRVAGWRRGLLSASYTLYSSAGHPLKLYLNDWARYMRTPRINGKWSVLLDDKCLFEQFFGGLVRVPRTHGLLVYGKFLPKPHTPEVRTLAELVERHGRDGIVFKPIRGGGGREIKILKREGDDLLLNGEPVNLEELQKRLDKRHQTMAVEFIEQHEYSATIFPGSLNCIRILTLIDPETGKAFVARALHRFGSAATAPVDNSSKGGLGCIVDVETGELSAGIIRVGASKFTPHDRHPDTGAQITGVRVPGWSQMISELLKMVEHVGVLPYVGWDVAMTPDGFSVIEGNSWTGVQLLQIYEPLLADERIRRFYRHYGVVR
jgi:hypothetical protein